MQELTSRIRSCMLCAESLPHLPKPIFRIQPGIKLLIIGQAPGVKAHDADTPFYDKSGETLINWMGVKNDTFYKDKRIGVLPMGLCYPGRGRGGDAPPAVKCAPAWHGRVLEAISGLQLTLLVGKYAQDYYLSDKLPLTTRVKNYKEYLPQYFPLVHPSPRNISWRQKNSWFQNEVLPDLKERVRKIMA